MQLDPLLKRRLQDILPNEAALVKRLQQDKPLRVYQGFDPTGTKLHLGHSIGMRNLQRFVELGADVIVLFGTGTVLVGDPSERDTGRKLITQEEIDANIKSWKKQVSRIIDLDRVTIKMNGDWLINLKLKDIINIASHISAIQLFKRESFTRRIDKGDTVWAHEVLYPLLQGYDSVVMDVDAEIGGTDQTFNMLMGRELQQKINNRDKLVLTNPMILGTDGKQMSKTSNNCIWLEDSAEDMYGKTMSIADNQIQIYYQLLTDLDIPNQTQIQNQPMETKKTLAFDIAKQFHGLKGATQAQQTFEATVQNNQLPDDIPELKLDQTKTILEVLQQANFGNSNGERKRMLAQGGVKLEQTTITDPQYQVELEQDQVIRYGKRKYIKIKPT